MINHSWGRDSTRRMQGVDARLVACATAVLKRCPCDLTIPILGGLRTQEEQQRLYARGRTRSGKIVTQLDGVKRQSMHQSGRALDIVPWDPVRQAAVWPPAESWDWDEIQRWMNTESERMGIDLVWGGNWKGFTDCPHWEIIRR